MNTEKEREKKMKGRWNKQKTASKVVKLMQTSIITFTHIICEEHNTTVKIQKLSDWINKKGMARQYAIYEKFTLNIKIKNMRLMLPGS